MRSLSTCPLAREKSRLRSAMKQRRQALSADQRALFSHRIAEHVFKLPKLGRATVVFIYLSHNDEVATPAIVDRLCAEGKIVLVPRIIDGTQMAACRFQGWDKLLRGPLGILYPSDSKEHFAAVDVALTPGLAFSTAGARLGFGAGYYDRWFSTHGANVKIGLSFESQLLISLPTDQTDVPMDLIVTESRCIHVSAQNQHTSI
ncbi:MAG: 5-formyltetrahydrofolate cyclo-ligase [Gammaproteobacteria bacterium]